MEYGHGETWDPGELVDFQESPPPNSRIIYNNEPMSIKSSKGVRILAQMSKELLTNVRIKKDAK